MLLYARGSTGRKVLKVRALAWLGRVGFQIRRTDQVESSQVTLIAKPLPLPGLDWQSGIDHVSSVSVEKEALRRCHGEFAILQRVADRPSAEVRATLGKRLLLGQRRR